MPVINFWGIGLLSYGVLRVAIFKVLAVRFPSNYDADFYAIPGMAKRNPAHEVMKRKNPFSDIIEMMNYLDEYDMIP